MEADEPGGRYRLARAWFDLHARAGLGHPDQLYHGLLHLFHRTMQFADVAGASMASSSVGADLDLGLGGRLLCAVLAFQGSCGIGNDATGQCASLPGPIWSLRPDLAAPW